MSFTFYTALSTPPARSLFEDLGIRHVKWCQPLADDDRLVRSSAWHLYVEGSSTRGVQIGFEDGRLRARLQIGSAPADFKVALAVMRAAARVSSSRVELAGVDPVTVDEMDRLFNDCWIRRMADFGAWALRDHALEQGGIRLPCPVRDFDLGLRVLQQLDAGASARFPHRLLAAIGRLQFLDPHRYMNAGQIEARVPSGRLVELTVWTPEQGYLFPPLPHILMMERDGQGIVIRNETVLELPKVQAQWADEHRLLVEPVPKALWPVAYAAALCHRVDPITEWPA